VSEEAVYGPEHPEVATPLGNLGIVQERLGEFERRHARRSSARSRSMRPSTDPSTPRSRARSFIWATSCVSSAMPHKQSGLQERALAIETAV
jgi:hypothetical protein